MMVSLVNASKKWTVFGKKKKEKNNPATVGIRDKYLETEARERRGTIRCERRIE